MCVYVFKSLVNLLRRLRPKSQMKEKKPKFSRTNRKKIAPILLILVNGWSMMRTFDKTDYMMVCGFKSIQYIICFNIKATTHDPQSNNHCQTNFLALLPTFRHFTLSHSMRVDTLYLINIHISISISHNHRTEHISNHFQMLNILWFEKSLLKIA